VTKKSIFKNTEKKTLQNTQALSRI